MRVCERERVGERMRDKRCMYVWERERERQRYNREERGTKRKKKTAREGERE